MAKRKTPAGVSFTAVDDQAICFELCAELRSLAKPDAILAHYKSKDVDEFLLSTTRSQFSALEEARGTRLAERGEFEVHGFPAIRLPGELTWAENPFCDRHWQFQLHRWRFTSSLLASHAATHDERCLEKLASLIEGWMRVNAQATPPCEFSWQDHATALRLLAIIQIWEYVRRRNVDENFLLLLLRLAFIHAEMLTSDEFYSVNNNHGLDQSYILYWAGRVFREMKRASEWVRIGKARLVSEIEWAFTEEGVHKENSPDYHEIVLSRALTISKLLSHYGDSKASGRVSCRVEMAIRFLAYIVRPDGRLPIIGDTQLRRPPKKYDGLEGSPQHAHFCYARSGGREGYPPAEVDATFPRSGYAIFRDEWRPAKSFEAGVHLVFKSGFLSRMHRHDDDLSFVLYAGGEDWIIDSGLYKYQERDKIRRYVRSAAGHNVVLISGMTPKRRLSVPNEPGIEFFEHGRCASFVEATTSIYHPYVVRRRLTYVRPYQIYIADTITGSGHRTRANLYQALFHLPSDKHLSRLSNGVVAESRTSRWRLEIRDIDGVFGEIEVVSGIEEPECQGWVSEQYGQITASQVVTFTQTAKNLACRFELTLVPG